MAHTVALITGGGLGLGEAISRRLAQDGMAVGILDLDLSNAAKCAREIEDSGGTAIPIQADVSIRAEVETAVAEIRAALGPITVLVNNAGVSPFKNFRDITDDEWDVPMRINLKGTFIVTQTVLPDMEAAKWGRIVNISSSSAQVGADRMVHYSASKGGIIAMTKSLARELGPLGITVNNIPPNFIMTPGISKANSDGNLPFPLEDLKLAAPVRRAGEASDIASACSFLVSPEARYVTGQTLGVNGGRVIY